jgi:hypothetical protein
MRAAVLAICFLGCSSPKGVAIEVHPGATSSDTVELFIGRTACHDPDCGGIEPPGIFGKLSGTIAYRDGDAIDSAPMVDGAVTFQLVPDKVTETLPLVIAVGFTNGDPDSVAIIRDLEISSEPQLVYATLSGATSHVRSVPANTSIPDGDRVEVWREKNVPMSSCVVVQRWRNNQPEHLFVVPTDDPDCDDVPNGPLECNQDVFHASTAPKSLGSPNECVALFPDMGEPICRVGGQGCTDGVGVTQCAPMPYCLPEPVCDVSAGCPTPNPMCLRQRFANITGISRVNCQVPTDLGAPCTGVPSTTIDFGPAFGPATTTCTGVSFDPLLLSDTQLGFQPTLRFPSGFELSASGPQPPCAFDATWQGHGAVTQTEDDHGLMQLDVDNGQHIIIPIVIEYLPGQCPTVPFSCSVDFGTNGSTGGFDSVWNCVD